MNGIIEKLARIQSKQRLGFLLGLVAGIFVAFSAVFLVLTMVNDVNTYRAAVAAGKPAVINFALGTALVVIGVPIYFFYRKRNAAAASDSTNGA